MCSTSQPTPRADEVEHLLSGAAAPGDHLLETADLDDLKLVVQPLVVEVVLIPDAAHIRLLPHRVLGKVGLEVFHPFPHHEKPGPVVGVSGLVYHLDDPLGDLEQLLVVVVNLGQVHRVVVFPFQFHAAFVVLSSPQKFTKILPFYHRPAQSACQAA